MDVFIVRPFGNRPVLKQDKTTGNHNTVMFDFDKVEAQLIAPAIDALGLPGGTTSQIWAPGSIHKDMFSFLLVADIVIADITIHNANVFYELGIRHALRDKKTILLKCPGYDDTPFDIAGYRYLNYDIANPAATLEALKKTISETIASNRADSPVYDMLPQLKTQDPEKFITLPDDFLHEFNLAEGARQEGKLSLLAQEAGFFYWRITAWRRIGEALYNLKAYDAARTVWEKIIALNKNDLLANDRLATIYQRLAEKEAGLNPDEAAELLTRSDIAIQKLLEPGAVSDAYKRAEALALKARNSKTRWINNWQKAPAAAIPLRALQSGYLRISFEQYELAFLACMNHFYSGVNALGLLITLIDLAKRYPGEWELGYAGNEEAQAALRSYEEKKQVLVSAIQLSLESAQRKNNAAGTTDIWQLITAADLTCLIENKPARVAATYNKALEGGNALHHDAARRQLHLYEQLGVLEDNVKAALSVLQQQAPAGKGTQYVLFTGHMIDMPDRPVPRFPPAKEEAVRQRIREILHREKTSTTEELEGISGGACGGDILFHELCEEMGISTRMCLALPRDLFIEESVQFAGTEWVKRFDRLYRKLPHPVLATTKELPAWLSGRENYSIWERNNGWMLNAALVNGGINLTLIALWDGKGGDGPGGTADMVRQARKMGAKVEVIDIDKL